MTKFGDVREAIETYGQWSEDQRDFHSGYVRTMLWANTLADRDGEIVSYEGDSLDSDALDITAWAQTVLDCDAFLTIELDADDDMRVTDLIDTLNYGIREAQSRYDLAGHDFALTRNHHGAGFWDRGLGEAGDTLTMWAQTFSEASFYYDGETITHD